MVISSLFFRASPDSTLATLTNLPQREIPPSPAASPLLRMENYPNPESPTPIHCIPLRDHCAHQHLGQHWVLVFPLYCCITMGSLFLTHGQAYNNWYVLNFFWNMNLACMINCPPYPLLWHLTLWRPPPFTTLTHTDCARQCAATNTTIYWLIWDRNFLIRVSRKLVYYSQGVKYGRIKPAAVNLGL